MHLDKPSVGKYFQDSSLKGYQILQKIFFTSSTVSQAAGQAFIDRLMLRETDRDPVSGQEIASAQLAAFREWDQPNGERFSELRGILQPTLIVNGVRDQLISVNNSYSLENNLPDATLIVYPDSGHGAIFQFHEAFARQAIFSSLQSRCLRRIDRAGWSSAGLPSVNSSLAAWQSTHGSNNLFYIHRTNSLLPRLIIFQQKRERAKRA